MLTLTRPDDRTRAAPAAVDAARVAPPLLVARLAGISGTAGHHVATFLTTDDKRVEVAFVGSERTPQMTVDGASPRAINASDAAGLLTALGRDLAEETAVRHAPRAALRRWVAQLDATFRGVGQTVERTYVQRAQAAMGVVADEALGASFGVVTQRPHPAPFTSFPGLASFDDASEPRFAFSRANLPHKGGVHIVGVVEGARTSALRDLQIALQLSPDDAPQVCRQPWGRAPDAAQTATDAELAAFLRLSVDALARHRPLAEHAVLWRVEEGLAALQARTLNADLRGELNTARSALRAVLLPRLQRHTPGGLEPGGFDATPGTAAAMATTTSTTTGAASPVAARMTALRERR